MKIVALEVANFMKLRQMKILLKRKGLTQVTGRNGAGKSTLVRFIEWMLDGPTSIPAKLKKNLVRNGADRAWGQLELKDDAMGHFLVTRSVTRGGTQDLDIIDKTNGDRVKNQQKWLKDLITGLSFDPLLFAQMDTEDQIEELKRLAVVDLDFDAFAEADKADTEARRKEGQERDRVQAQVDTFNTDELVDLPPQKFDEAAIFTKLSEANETYRKAQDINNAKRELGAAAARIGLEKIEVRRRIERRDEDITRLEAELKKAREERKQLGKDEADIQKRHEAAEKAFNDAPVGETVDVEAISAELRKAQRYNRLIDVRAQYDALNAELENRRRAWFAADDRIKAREKLRAEAIANAKLPVKGLTFDERQVYFDRNPLGSLGEGEQIRISTLLGIHMNPKLQAMCIQHGEALDEDGLAIIEKLAVEHDFQIVMARVETSGNVGIVIEDGMVKKINEEAKA